MTTDVNATNNVKPQSFSLCTVGGAFQVAAALIWIPQAWFLASAIDAMAKQEAVWSTAIWAALWFAALGIVRSICHAVGVRKSYLMARRSLTKMRAKALEALSLRSPLDISRPSSGHVASVIGEQAEMIVPYLARYQPARLKVMTVPMVIAAAVFYHSWLAAIILMCLAPLIPIFMILFGYGAQKASANQILEVGQMNGFLLDRLRGLSTIRAFDGVEMISQKLQEISELVRKKTMKVLSIAFLSSAVMELFSSLGVAMLAVYIGFHLLGEGLSFGTWAGRMSLGQGMFILLLAPTFFDPLRELSAVWHDRASGVAAVNAIDALKEKGMNLLGKNASELQLTDESKDALTGALAVVAQEISFQYPEATEKVIDRFNLNIKAGEKVALVAPSGYGKSTLLAMFAGLLPATEGQITIGGLELNHDTADVLRTRMGWISQHPHLFSNSLFQNVTLGRKQVDQDAFEKAVQASAFSHVAKEQVHRRLGEGAGAGISGGEVLRLALARAMVTPNLGLLLADEQTAHLDSTTAEEVIANLMSLVDQGVTLVVATHDERLLPYMDQVIRLEDYFARGRT